MRLVQNDKGVVQRASAHIGQRCDLNGLLFYAVLVVLRTHHFKERIVKRAQIGVDLTLQITRQKAQSLARLNGRTGQYDATDLLVPQRLDRHRDGQKRFTRTGRSHAKGHGVFADGVYVLLLPHRLGLDGLAAHGHADTVVAHLLKASSLARARHVDDIAHRLLRHDLPLSGKQSQLSQHTFRGLQRARVLALHSHNVTVVSGAVSHRHAKGALHQLYILIKGAEHPCGDLGTVHRDTSFFQAYNDPFFIIRPPSCPPRKRAVKRQYRASSCTHTAACSGSENN